MSKRYAFFDFDGTLTCCDSLLPFLRFVVGKRRYYLNIILLSPILIGYFLKLIRNDYAKTIVLRKFLAGIDVTILQEMAEQFAKEELPKLLRTEGMEKLAFHQKKGDLCVLVSASPELYLKPWANFYGFSEVIGTILEIKDQKYTGNIAGKNCYGEEKVIRINSKFDLECWQNSSAYSDSLADLPLLKRASQSFLLKKKAFTQFSLKKSYE